MHAMPRIKDFIHVCLKQLESYEAPQRQDTMPRDKVKQLSNAKVMQFIIHYM